MSENKQPKKGIKTTEFWLAIASTIFMILVGTGVVGEQEADSLFEVLGPWIGATVTLVTYIISRTRLKERALENGGPPPIG